MKIFRIVEMQDGSFVVQSKFTTGWMKIFEWFSSIPHPIIEYAEWEMQSKIKERNRKHLGNKMKKIIPTEEEPCSQKN